MYQQDEKKRYNNQLLIKIFFVIFKYQFTYVKDYAEIL